MKVTLHPLKSWRGKRGPGMTIEPLPRDPRDKIKRTPAEEMWLRRQAVNLIPNLPEDPDEAIAVLHYAEEFYRRCVMVEPERPQKTA